MKRIVYLGACAAALAVAVAGTAGAALVEPTLVLGNPSCRDAVTVNNPSSGTFGGVTISVTNTAKGPELSFTTNSASLLVTSVVVKGGPNANLYDYGAPGVQADSGLHSPLNTNNGKWFGLSHVCFFTDKKKTPPPPKKDKKSSTAKAT
jgi:hypothetical protein